MHVQPRSLRRHLRLLGRRTPKFTDKGSRGSHHWAALDAADARPLADSAAHKAAATGRALDDAHAQAEVRTDLGPALSSHDTYEVVATGYEFAAILARARRPLSSENPTVELSEADLRDGLFVALTTAPGDPVADATSAWHDAATALHTEAARGTGSGAGDARVEARTHLNAAIDDRLETTR